MWALVWLALSSTQHMETYHLGNYKEKETCVQEMSKASVLVTDRNQTVDCIWIDLDK